jgi:hypothetical protein
MARSLAEYMQALIRAFVLGTTAPAPETEAERQAIVPLAQQVLGAMLRGWIVEY